MPRFAILEHDWPSRHWDLFLEAEGVLKAWRLLAEPRPGLTVPAELAADHRLLYLDYEGEVQGGRGTVKRWDAGTFCGEPCGEAWEVAICGLRLNGLLRYMNDEITVSGLEVQLSDLTSISPPRATCHR